LKTLKGVLSLIFSVSGEKVKSLELQTALESMGLTEYEAKAYISLIQVGASNAGNLSKITEIPHSKIYEVLIRLEKKKLIEVQKGRPLFFKAIKPSIALKGMETELKDNLKNELSQRKNDLDILYEKKLEQISKAHNMLGELDTFYEKNVAIEPSEEFIWTIRGRDNLNGQAKEIIQSASTEVRLMMHLMTSLS
jgi:sugar-specific transcriptional regulator TrmB